MTIRRATEAEEAELHSLWAEFCAEVPEPPGFPPETWEEQWKTLRAAIATGAVYVAEEGGGLVGIAEVLAPDRGVSHLEWAHVRPAFQQG